MAFPRPLWQQPAMLDPETRVLILTDGKAGDENQCRGVVEALGVEPDIRRIAPRPPFSWLAPWGPADPRDPAPFAPPMPDIVVASGRRAVPYVRRFKALSGGRAFTVILKDPRSGAGSADFLWAPAHDRLRGDNVLTTLTSPHLVSRARLAGARKNPPLALAALTTPRAAVLVGGDSRHFTFSEADIAAFAGRLADLAGSGVALMGTLSRRTPPALAAAVRGVFEKHRGWLWDGSGESPVVALLALADAVVVTADSVNMVGEAAATGRPILIFTPAQGGHRKISAFLDEFRARGAVHNFEGRLEGAPYEPIDSTPDIAAAIAARYREFRRTRP